MLSKHTLFFKFQYLVGPPSLSITACRGLGMDETKLFISPEVNLLHVSVNVFFSDLQSVIQLCRIFRSKSYQTCFIRFKSGLCMGALYRIHSLTVTAVCLGSLSCIKIQPSPRPKHSTEAPNFVAMYFCIDIGP